MLNLRKVRRVHLSKKGARSGRAVGAYQPSSVISSGKMGATTTATALRSEC